MESAWGPASARAEDWFRSNFTDFIGITRADGVVPVVATQGTLVAAENFGSEKITRHISVEMVGLSLEDLLDLWQWANDAIMEIAAQQGVLGVDVYGQLPHSMTYLEDHVHLAPEGQVAVAEIFCQAMVASPEIRAVFANRPPTGDRSPSKRAGRKID